MESYDELLGRILFRILPMIHDGALLIKYPTTLRRWLFLQKSSSTDIPHGSKYSFDQKVAVNVGCR